MQDFYYPARTDIIFGRCAECKVGEGLKEFGAKNVLLCYGRESAVKSGLIGRITASLTENGISYVLYGGISANPTKQHALQGCVVAKENKVDFVLAVGGGSVMDEAKCIAASLKNEDIWSYYLRQKPETDLVSAVPIGVVLTIPASGSEGSTASVVRDEESGFKYSIHSNAIRPALAFINPELCFTLPKEQIANGASDILAHLLERYFSPLSNVTVSDGLIGSAIQSVLRIAPMVYNNPTNYDYWSELCILGTLAHNGMLDMGREEQDWGTHVIENKVLSGLKNIAHGTGLAILFPAWLRLVSHVKPARLVQFATEVMQVDGGSDMDKINNAISKLEQFYKVLGLPVTLAEVGIKPSDIIPHLSTFFNMDTRLGAYGQLNLKQIENLVLLAR